MELSPPKKRGGFNWPDPEEDKKESLFNWDPTIKTNRLPQPFTGEAPQTNRISYAERLRDARENKPGLRGQVEDPNALQKEFLERRNQEISEKMVNGETYAWKDNATLDAFLEASESQEKPWMSFKNAKAFWHGLGMVGQDLLVNPVLSGGVLRHEGGRRDALVKLYEDKAKASSPKKTMWLASRLSETRETLRRGRTGESGEGIPGKVRELFVQQEREKGEVAAGIFMQDTEEVLSKIPKFLQTERSKSLQDRAGTLSDDALAGAYRMIDKKYLGKAMGLLSKEQQEKVQKLNPQSLSDFFEVDKQWKPSTAKTIWNALRGEVAKDVATVGESVLRAGMDIQILLSLIGQGGDSPAVWNAEGRLNTYLNSKAREYWNAQGKDYSIPDNRGIMNPDLEGIPESVIAGWRGSAGELVEAVQAKKRKEWYLLNQLQADRERARLGKDPLLAELLGEKYSKWIRSDAAEGLSYVIDLPAVMGTSVVIGSRAALKGSQASATRGPGLLARGATESGKLIRSGGKVVEEIPSKIRGKAGDVAARTTGTVAAKEATEEVIKNTQHVLLTPFAWASDIMDFSGKVIGKTGEVVEGVGRQAGKGRTSTGLLAGMSTDESLSLSTRSVAGALKRVDPALSLGADFGRGSGAGGLTGFGLGALTGDPEVAFGAMGAGFGIGTVSVIPARLVTASSKLELQNDINTWKQRYKTQEETLRGLGRIDEADTLRDVRQVLEGQDFDTQVRVAELEDLVRGVSAQYGLGEVPVKWFYDPDQIGRGYYDPENGAVHINLAHKAPDSLAHEVMHAMEQIPHEGLQNAISEMNKSLFGVAGPDGKRVGGMFASKDQVDFANQYLNELYSPIEKDMAALKDLPKDSPLRAKLEDSLSRKLHSWRQWLEARDLSPDTRSVTSEQFESRDFETFRSTIDAEIRAELFRSSYMGQEAGFTYKANSVKRQFIDSILLKSSSSKLGSLRIWLEGKMKVKFDASGTPSSIFFKDGEGLTSSPQVNAMMRNYITIRKNIRSRMPPEGLIDDPGVSMKPEDLAKPENAGLFQLFKDNDNIARDRNGEPITLDDGTPVLLKEPAIKKVQEESALAIMNALDAVPSERGLVKSVAEDGKVRWEGANFTREQVDALLMLPDHVFPPGKKEKLLFIFEQMQDGNPINFNYNAALGRSKKYSSSISAKWAHDWVYGVEITKAGNVNYRTININHVQRKIRQWSSEKKKGTFLDLWDGNVNEFSGSLAQYLHNHRVGQPGETHLHSDTKISIEMKERLNELVGVYKSEEARTKTIAPRVKRGPERARRLDRINWAVPSSATEWKLDVGKLRHNYMPAGVDRPHSPKARKMIQGLQQGKKLNRAALGRALEKEYPIKEVPVPKRKDLPTKSEMFNALNKGQREKIGLLDQIEANESITIRQDVDSMVKSGVGVVTVKGGGVTTYENFVRISDPRLITTDPMQRTALKIGAGGPKQPTIVIKGKKHPRQIIPRNMKDWTQVGFNPDRHSFYYDRKTGEPIVGGTDAVQVGNTVFVKNAVPGKKSDFLYMPAGPKAARSTTSDIRAIAKLADLNEPKLFRSGLGSKAKDIESIAKHHSKPGQEIKVKPWTVDDDPYGARSNRGDIKLQMTREGGHVSEVNITLHKDGNLHIDSSMADSNLMKSGGGDQFYQVALDFAFNAGRKRIPDPNGLSEVASKRLISQLLSSGLKHKSFKHIANPALRQPGRESLSNPTKLVAPWDPKTLPEGMSDFDYKAGVLALTELKNVRKVFPEISSFQVDPKSGLLTGNVDGKIQTYHRGDKPIGGSSSLEGLVNKIRSRPGGDFIGETTLIRSAGYMGTEGRGYSSLLLGHGEQAKPGVSKLPGLSGLEETFYMPAGRAEKANLKHQISTRFPTAVARTDDPIASVLNIGLDTIKGNKDQLKNHASIVRKYPGVKIKSRSPEAAVEEFINHGVNNLLWLHDLVPEGTRNRSAKWYDGANKKAASMSKEYGTEVQGNAGALAALSPQKDWFMNVSLGERVVDISTNQRGTKFGKDLESWLLEWGGGDPKIQALAKSLKGKSFDQLNDYGKSAFIRAYDEVNNSRSYDIVSPEGKVVGIATTKKGDPAKVAWGSMSEINKALRVTLDPSVENISKLLGNAHKVRNFYNNILLPNADGSSVTIDTHAVAAALLRPLAGNDLEVGHNFGTASPVKNSSITGAQGTYGIYAEMYRRAATERGILPRQMQSITWEAVRGLYEAKWKTKSNKNLIDNIWKQHETKGLSLDETRQRILDESGGITPPEWERSGGAAVKGTGSAGDTGKLSPSKLRQGRTGDDARTRGRTPRDTSSKVDYMPAGKGGDIFYSNSSKALESPKVRKSATGPAMLNDILRQDPAALQEMKWMDLDRHLMEHKGKITKEEVQDFIDANQVKVVEKVRGGEDGPKIKKAEMRVEDAERKMWAAEDRGTHEDYRLAEDEYTQAVEDLEHFSKGEDTAFNKPDLVLPGAKKGSYRELELMLPSPKRAPKVTVEKRPTPLEPDSYKVIVEGGQAGSGRGDVAKRYATRAEAEVAAARVRKLDLKKIPTKEPFTQSHFEGDENVFAHVRFNERTDADGKRMLFIEEVQSDWAAKGRDEGFGAEKGLDVATREFNDLMAESAKRRGLKPGRPAEPRQVQELLQTEGFADHYSEKIGRENYLRLRELSKRDASATPAAPFVSKRKGGKFVEDDKWRALAVKRMIRWASDEGFDRVGWINGRDTADRYNLSKFVDRIEYQRLAGDDMTMITAWDKAGNKIIHDRKFGNRELKGAVSKGIAEKIIADKSGQGEFTGMDLVVGGEGHKQFYDVDLPNYTGKYVKKWGGKVGEVEFSLRAAEDAEALKGIPERIKTAHYIDITPAMKESVMTEGQAMFMPAGSDASYMKAAKKGDTKGAQLLVDQAAKAAGYTRRVFHGTDETWTVLDINRRPSTWPTYAMKKGMGKSEGLGWLPLFTSESRTSAATYGPKVMELYTKPGERVAELDAEGGYFSEFQEPYQGKNAIADEFREGADVVVVKNVKDNSSTYYGADLEEVSTVVVIKNPSSIKSADPITKDADGNIIPLSERFNPGSDDIRYMPAGEEGGKVKRKGSATSRKPGARIPMGAVAKQLRLERDLKKLKRN